MCGCGGTKYIQAPADNAWRLYFQRVGLSHYNVLVPCPACNELAAIGKRHHPEQKAVEK
jgi:hypothetical protein